MEKKTDILIVLNEVEMSDADWSALGDNACCAEGCEVD